MTSLTKLMDAVMDIINDKSIVDKEFMGGKYARLHSPSEKRRLIGDYICQYTDYIIDRDREYYSLFTMEELDIMLNAVKYHRDVHDRMISSKSLIRKMDLLIDHIYKERMKVADRG